MISGVEAIRFETTVGQGGTVTVPDTLVGERVEVIVLKLGAAVQLVRKGGWAEGKVRILPGFDEPTPGMEAYV